MGDSRPVNMPIAAHFKFTAAYFPKSKDEISEMSRVPYSEIVGSIMYLMLCTRPDLAHSISLMSRFMSNPGRLHWEGLKWVLRYIKGTLDHCLIYKYVSDEIELIGYTDSDYAGDLIKRKSTSAYYFTLNGCCISWKSQL